MSHGIDNDGDGLVDGLDSDCPPAPLTGIRIIEETCCTVCPGGNLIVYMPFWYGQTYFNSYNSNLAFRKPIALSSRALSGSFISNPLFAIDNQLDNHQIARTLVEEEPFLSVNLQGYFNLDSITVSGKDDCCFSTSYDYRILLSETPFNGWDLNTLLADPTVQSYSHSQVGNAEFTIQAGNFRARYVRIYLEGIGQLSIKELRITGGEDASSNPYDYQWSDASVGNTATPTCLAPGIYQVTVTDQATGGFATASYTVE